MVSDAKSASPQSRSNIHGAAMTQFLRTAAVSEQTGIPVATLRWWRHIGEGPPSFRLGRKNVVYPRDELQRWIDRRQKLTTRGESA
jgi:predicted DNA-binding transcriptional regulator AlpA